MPLVVDPVPRPDVSICSKMHGADYSITSAACASTGAGISRPMLLAVLRLMTSSKFGGCWIGSSPVFAPLRSLLT